MKPKVWKSFFQNISCFLALGPFLPVSHINTQLGEKPVIEWKKIFGLSGNGIVYSVQQTTDGGYIGAGVTQLDDNKWNIWLLK